MTDQKTTDQIEKGVLQILGGQQTFVEVLQTSDEVPDFCIDFEEMWSFAHLHGVFKRSRPLQILIWFVYFLTASVQIVQLHLRFW